jgi:hypothetical protein
MSNPRKSTKTSSLQTTTANNPLYPAHKNRRMHLDMGTPGFGADSSGGNSGNQNLFEIKKRSIDFFQQVTLNSNSQIDL